MSTVAQVSGNAATGTLGDWGQEGDSIYAISRRGYVEYDLQAPESDMYRLEVWGGAHSNLLRWPSGFEACLRRSVIPSVFWLNSWGALSAILPVHSAFRVFANFPKLMGLRKIRMRTTLTTRCLLRPCADPRSCPAKTFQSKSNHFKRKGRNVRKYPALSHVYPVSDPHANPPFGLFRNLVHHE